MILIIEKKAWQPRLVGKRLHLQKEVHGMNGVPQSYFAQAFAVRRGSRSLVVAVERTDQVERKQNLQETNMC